MILQYFERRVEEGKTAGQLLLIEEPEAHLHPQLQRILFNALKNKRFQTIITTHSTHISSQASLESMVILTNDGSAATKSTCPTDSSLLSNKEIADLERYLDATRGTLLYAKAVMLVEGPSELFLITALVRDVMGIRLEEEGISVVPIYGTHFNVYTKLFGPDGVPKKCAIVTDGDQTPSDARLEDVRDLAEFPSQSVDLSSLQNSYVRLFLCKRTLELEITNEGTLNMLSRAARDLGATAVAQALTTTKRKLAKSRNAAERASLLESARSRVLNTAKRFGKARFSQVASKYSNRVTWLPDYIRDAVTWLIATND